jgi:hypothetical protein
MVKSSPTPSFAMAEAQLLFEVAIVSLDPPTHLRNGDKILKCHCFRQRRKPIFKWFLVAFRPFDKEPFFGSWLGEIIVSRSDNRALYLPKAGPAILHGLPRPVSLKQWPSPLSRRSRFKLSGVRWQPMCRSPGSRRTRCMASAMSNRPCAEPAKANLRSPAQPRKLHETWSQIHGNAFRW